MHIIARCSYSYNDDNNTEIFTKDSLYDILKQDGDKIKIESNVGVSIVSIDVVKKHFNILENNIGWREQLEGFN